MKLRKTDHWSQISELEGLLYLGQRLDEMLFDYTLDTYKPAALNSLFLCNEALSLISDIESDVIDAQNLDHVMEELLWSLRQDEIAKDLLDLQPDYYVQTNKDTPLSLKRRRLEVLESSLGVYRYIKAGNELLTKAVEKNSKSEIDAILRCYIPALINFGVSKLSLFEKVNDFFFNPERRISDLSQIQDFLREIYPVAHEFQVILLVSNLVLEVKESINDFGLIILEELPEDFEAAAKVNAFEAPEGYVYVKAGDIRAVDNYSAREEAEQKIEQLSQLFTFFSHKAQLKWDDRVLLSRCCQTGISLIRRPLPSIQKCSDTKPQFAAPKMNKFLRSITLRDASFVKFKQAIELHGMALSSSTPDNQLLNLWIAIETITPSSLNGGSKIARIVTDFMPFLLERYVERLIIRLTKDLFRWNRKACHEIIAKIDGGKKFHQKVLRLVILDEYDDLRKELYSKLNSFPLLRNRIFSLNSKLKNPAKVKTLLDAHKQKVEWQLRRIYRTRNLVVHSGRTPTFIDTLIENSHDYLDQILNKVIYFGVMGMPVKTLDQAFDLAEARYILFERKLSESKEFNNGNIFMLMPD
ncbi:hypothetical protein D9X30_2695 [Cupriavidus sp. U2]|uniref:hypothetical protein n=1 Tax=Cupriavidus sp. U2 TaxID=2920269 RepID=UPI00129E3242|nr:hypothetical protein [Cupriavidus sp. U2]KAI3592298.1 hypothetical protein D9X30_2695 [Cupriavidus sp. U2]